MIGIVPISIKIFELILVFSSWLRWRQIRTICGKICYYGFAEASISAWIFKTSYMTILKYYTLYCYLVLVKHLSLNRNMLYGYKIFVQFLHRVVAVYTKYVTTFIYQEVVHDISIHSIKNITIISKK